MKRVAAGTLLVLGCASNPPAQEPSGPAAIPSASAAPSAAPSATASASSRPAPAPWSPPAVVNEETFKQSCMWFIGALEQVARPGMAPDAAIQEMQRKLAESLPAGITVEQVTWCANEFRRSVAEYIQKSIDVEAKNALRFIAKDMVAAYEREQLGPGGKSVVHKLCPSAKPVPDALAKLSPQYASAEGDWMKDAGWSCLKFEMSAPQRFQYEVKVDGGKSFVAYARRTTEQGLLEFSYGGEVKNDAVVLWPEVREKRAK